MSRKRALILRQLFYGATGVFFTDTALNRPFTAHWWVVLIAGYGITLLLLALAWVIVLGLRALLNKRGERVSHFDAKG